MLLLAVSKQKIINGQPSRRITRFSMESEHWYSGLDIERKSVSGIQAEIVQECCRKRGLSTKHQEEEMSNEPEKWSSLEEIAEHLGVSKDTIRA